MAVMGTGQIIVLRASVCLGARLGRSNALGCAAGVSVGAGARRDHGLLPPRRKEAGGTRCASPRPGKGSQQRMSSKIEESSYGWRKFAL